MKIYFGCPTGKRRDDIVSKYGDEFGACLTRDVFNKITANKMPWFFDNGAFADFKNGKVFDSRKFFNKLVDLEIGIRKGSLNAPDFVVVPDIVGGGRESLQKSLKWMQYLEENFPHNKYYLAVQDNMPFREVALAIKSRLFDGIFIGGTKAWKYKNSEVLANLAHWYGLPAHCGGIGTPKDILWAKGINIDSVDSGIAMIHPKYLPEVLNIRNHMLWECLSVLISPRGYITV